MKGTLKGATAAAVGTIGGASLIITQTVLLPHERGLLTVPLPFGLYFDVLILLLGVIGLALLYQKRIKGPVLVGIYGLIGLVAYPLLYRGGF